MLLNYFQATNTGKEALKQKAMKYITEGYQRLLTYQSSDGGFGLYCGQPSEFVYTAYAGIFFSDMEKVYPIDKSILSKIENWLLKNIKSPANFTHNMQSNYMFNVHIAGSIAQFIYSLKSLGVDDGRLSPYITLMLEALSKRKVDRSYDSYILALCLNAIPPTGKYRKEAKEISDLLASYAENYQGKERKAVYWNYYGRTLYRSCGFTASVETTALAVQGFLIHGFHYDLVEQGLDYLIATRGPRGDWDSTSSTVSALKALILANSGSITKCVSEYNGTFHFGLEEQTLATLEINHDTAGVAHLVELGPKLKTGENKLSMSYKVKSGEIPPYNIQVASTYYLPWEKTQEKNEKEILLYLSYIGKKFQVGDLIQAQADISYHGKYTSGMIILDLGIPPGVKPDTEELDTMLQKGDFNRYDINGNHLIFYLPEMTPGSHKKILCPLRALTQSKSQTPVTMVYDYYAPSISAISAPQELVIE